MSNNSNCQYINFDSNEIYLYKIEIVTYSSYEVITVSFGSNLKAARVKKGLTQKELAALIGAKHNSVSNWENDQNKPDPDLIEIICGVLEITPNYLFNSDTMSSIMSLPGVLPLPHTVKKPRLGVIACGDPILAIENHDGYDDVPDNIHCDFTLKCKGDSMIGARIHDGDVVYIRQQPDVENNEIAAVMIDEEEVTLKRVYHDGDRLVLMAENPTFPPIIVNGEHTARIIGKAVGFTSIII